MTQKPVPEGYHTVTPYLVVEDVQSEIDFMTSTFDAIEKECLAHPDGKVYHAEVKLGDSIVMLGAASEGFPALQSMVHVYVGDVDHHYDRAIRNGAETIMEPSDQFYGDRSAGVKSPQGNSWWIATRIEDLTYEEMQKRMLEQKK